MAQGSALGERGSDAAALAFDRPADAGVNVGPRERVASLAGGGLLIAWGIRRGSIPGIAAAALGADLIYRGVTGRCPLYEALGLDTAAESKAGSAVSSAAPQLQRSITIGKSPDELYAFWRDPANLARVMAAFAEVTPRGEGVTHWRARGPLKQMLEWDSRQTEDQSNHRISWESLPGGAMPNRGEVAFRPAPAGEGTEVTLHATFEPPFGNLGAGVARAMQKLPRAAMGHALRRFKSLVETGEIPSLGNNPSGRGSSDRF